MGWTSSTSQSTWVSCPAQGGNDKFEKAFTMQRPAGFSAGAVSAERAAPGVAAGLPELEAW